MTASNVFFLSEYGPFNARLLKDLAITKAKFSGGRLVIEAVSSRVVNPVWIRHLRFVLLDPKTEHRLIGMICEFPRFIVYNGITAMTVATPRLFPPDGAKKNFSRKRLRLIVEAPGDVKAEYLFRRLDI